MRFNKGLVSIFLLTILNAETAFGEPLSQWSMGGQRGHANRSRGGWFREMNLTQEQMVKLRSIRHGRTAELKNLQVELEKRKAEIANLMKQGDGNKIREKNSEIQELRKKISDIYSDILIEANKLLTPEQRVKFAEHMQRMNKGADE